MLRIFHLTLVLLFIYIISTNTPPIMIINRIYENEILLSLLLFPFLVGLRTYQHPCNVCNPRRNVLYALLCSNKIFTQSRSNQPLNKFRSFHKLFFCDPQFLACPVPRYPQFMFFPLDERPTRPASCDL